MNLDASALLFDKLFATRTLTKVIGAYHIAFTDIELILALNIQIRDILHMIHIHCVTIRVQIDSPTARFHANHVTTVG